MNEIPQTKRGKGTYVDQSEHVLEHSLQSVVANKPLPFGWASTASTIACGFDECHRTISLYLCRGKY